MKSRDSMEFDVVIVGAGPAGLSAAIRLAQLDETLSICVVDKGAEIGSHILSGAVLEPRALTELFPNWREKGAPLHTPVKNDQFLLLTEKKSFKLPTPKPMQNDGNYIISLGLFCRWLADEAENLGVHLFPGFAAKEVLYEGNTVCGIVTGDKGIGKNGEPSSHYQPGMDLLAKQTFFAEGCRGSLTQTLLKRFQLCDQSDPQTYGIGIKELWEVPESEHLSGSVMHTVGWPLHSQTYGGSFLYYFEKNLLAIGFVVGLDYKNPYLNPYEEFQRFKSHPSIRPLLAHGKRIGYGARSLNEGGFQSIPKLCFPGGLLIGCAAGFLNVPKIKGIHTAMKSGMIAAESVFPLLKKNTAETCSTYPIHLKKSWVWPELHQVRNIRPAMKWGLLPGLAYAAFDTYVLRGHAPWTFHNHDDFSQLKKARVSKKIEYPKHDGKITFDLMTSVFLTHIHHEEDQPCHLKLIDPQSAIDINFDEYDSPEQRYCPAGVYEIIRDDNNAPSLQINASNCIHCKACDIKDPSQNIRWTPPEGGSGPQYESM